MRIAMRSIGNTAKARPRRRQHWKSASVLAAIGSICGPDLPDCSARSEEHTSELQSLMRISYAVFCLKKTTDHTRNKQQSHIHSDLPNQYSNTYLSLKT